jgi:hypothetical protein
MLLRLLLSSELLSSPSCSCVSWGLPVLVALAAPLLVSVSHVLARALRCATVVVLMWKVCTTLGWEMLVARVDSLPTLIFFPPLLAVPVRVGGKPSSRHTAAVPQCAGAVCVAGCSKL